MELHKMENNKAPPLIIEVWNMKWIRYDKITEENVQYVCFEDEMWVYDGGWIYRCVDALLKHIG